MAEETLITKSTRASSAGSRASSARAGFQALRRISCSSSNTSSSLSSTLPSKGGGGGGWKSLSLSRSSSSFSEGGSFSLARARSAELRRPMRLAQQRSSAEAAAPSATSAKPKPKPNEAAKPKLKSKRKAMIMPSVSRPLRAGALLPSASAPGALASEGDAVAQAAGADAADAAWPEPLTSPCKPSAQARDGWGGDGARCGAAAGAAAAGTAAPPAAACFSRGLLSRAQEQLSSELSRLQLAISELLDANLNPAEVGGAAEAVGASETSETSEAGEAASGLEARVRSLARRLGWARSDLALLRPHVEAHVEAHGDAGRPDELQAAELQAAELQRLLDAALTAEDFAASLRAELRTQAHAAEEARYGEVLLRHNLRVAPVPKDGNCLFGCAARWAALRGAADAAGCPDGAAAAAETAPDTDTPVEARAAAAGEAMDAVLEARGLGSAAALGEASAAQRGAVVAALREAVACDAHAGAGAGAGEAERAEVDLLLGEAQRGTAHDDTSVRLRAALQPLLAAGGALGTPGAREAYLDVMGRDGVFGARLEIETIARLLRAPVHLYYRLPGQPPPELDAASGLPPPQEVVEPPCGGTDAAAEPLRVLHMMSARHFDLLLPLV